ncbi:MAG: hypothetical protein KAI34_07535, partial [Candidatus Lokiarchaeota archaeon]|nr:hypothetical protein [Candidatus Lokiarchaeota archaeon]
MSSSIRKITLIALQLFITIIVISLSFNFAFTPKVTIISSNDESNLSLEDNITNLDLNGGSVDLNDPTGSGNG